MSIVTVFPNPLVKAVVFQITFPNLFYLERRIGDFQVQIMKEFPTSQLLIQRQVILLSGAPQVDRPQLSVPDGIKQPDEIQRVWQFTSLDQVQLDVTPGSLTLQSSSHKTYNNGDGRHFREKIESVCRSFIDVAQLPTITRMGLRYIDHGPIPKGDNDAFLQYYNSSLPLSCAQVNEATEMACRVATKRAPHNLIYGEALQITGDRRILVLDFDAWAENVEPSQLMGVADSLHSITSAAFEKTINQPIIDYMSKPMETSDVA